MKPLLSHDVGEARQRVLSLYKAWHRHIPFMLTTFNLPVSQATAYKQLRTKFEENKHVKDVRVIDMLVIKVRVVKSRLSSFKHRASIRS